MRLSVYHVETECQGPIDIPQEGEEDRTCSEDGGRALHG